MMRKLVVVGCSLFAAACLSTAPPAMPSSPPVVAPAVKSFDVIAGCGSPLAKAVITVNNVPQIANGDGYTLWALPDGSVTITVAATGYQSKTVTLTVAALAVADQHNCINLDPLPPVVPTVRRALVGQLRLSNKIFVDDLGPRNVRFASRFSLPRILRDNPAQALHELDTIAAAGWQGVRVFWAVGGYHGYWGGSEVAPVTFTQDDGTVVPGWTNFDDVMVQLLDACRARKLKLALTTGDIQFIFPNAALELAQHQHLATLIAQHGAADLIGSYNVRNEYYVNSPNVGDDANLAQMRTVADAVRAILPGVLVSTSNVGTDQDPPEYSAMASHGDDVQVHGRRSPGDRAIDYALHAVAWGEGSTEGYRPYAIWQMEPPSAICDHGGCTDPIMSHAELLAVYAMHAITGAASTFFQGNAVTPTATPLDAVWGFKEIPAVLDALIPEDVATWQHGYAHAGAIYWWFNATTTITVCVEGWDCTPAVPLQSATVVIGDQRFDNVANFQTVLTPGFKAALIVGRR